MNLKPDSNWTIFDNFTEDHTDFKVKFLPEIYLRTEVHADVRENFRVILKVLEQSYFEYKFYDIAVLKSMVTMEMALKLRYEELNGEKWDKKKPLIQLIDWFEKGNYFEVYNPEYLKSLRIIRNELAHPYSDSFGGSSGKHLISNVIDLINGLYEDPNLRAIRMQFTLQVIKIFEGLCKGMRISSKDAVYYSYRAWLGFYNNKSNPHEIHFYFKPCYEVPEIEFQNNTWTVSPVISCLANSIDIGSSEIVFDSGKEGELKVTGIPDRLAQEKYDHWIEKYKTFCDATGDHLFTHSGITDSFTTHLREFHKI